jgi:hypothetical protein
VYTLVTTWDTRDTVLIIRFPLSATSNELKSDEILADDMLEYVDDVFTVLTTYDGKKSIRLIRLFALSATKL